MSAERHVMLMWADLIIACRLEVAWAGARAGVCNLITARKLEGAGVCSLITARKLEGARAE